MEAARQGKKVEKQGTLDLMVGKSTKPVVFSREDVLHAVTKFVAVDDQVSLTLIFLRIPSYSTMITSRSQLQVNQCFETAWSQ